MCASPRGAPAATLAVSSPHIDARAYLKRGCLWRFCHRGNFVSQCSRVIVAESPLKTELPGVLKGVNLGASRGKAVSIYANWSVRAVRGVQARGKRLGALCVQFVSESPIRLTNIWNRP